MTAPDMEIARIFRKVIPADRVDENETARTFMASDIGADAAILPACVLRPRSADETVALVRAARRDGVALHPRGGGWSYTGAYAPQVTRSAIVDMSGLDHIAPLAADGTVTVGAGVTWSALDQALAAQGLRVPSFGPLSGIGAQIGATTAQNGGFFGAAAHGAIGEDSVAAVTLIDGRGDAQCLTQADRHDPVLGPQPLAGDCGAFGIKTAVTLDTMRRPETTLFASFALRDGAAMARAMASLAGLPGLGEVFSFDAGVHQNLAATGFTVLEAAGIAGDLLGAQGSWTDRLGGLIRTARAGKAHLADIPWSLHVSIDGTTTGAEEVRAEAARRIAAHDGEAIPDVIPRVTRAKPFRPIKALVTPLGERWLPSHGLVAANDAAPLVEQLQTALAASAAERAPHKMRFGFLVALFGRRITIEPQLYWPDSLSAYTRALAQPDQVKRFGAAPANEAGRALAARLRTQLIATMDAAHAGHFQIGRTYAACPGVPDAARATWPALKQKYDPDRIMNPGVLGL
jgi:FAD/FMN-containing dehydrogenase